ncbi:MAG: hypothetical protein LUC43_00560 [Burkholderiales bacterium]|nr:hypothetical protein [Burkholderiales bacterium]
MVVNADVLHRVMGKSPIVVEAKKLFDFDAIEKVVQGMASLGRTGDLKSDLRFAVVEPDFLAVKTMPETFFTNPFQESEKEALNRTIYGFSSSSLGEETIGEIQLIISYLRFHYGQNPPLKAWQGFDPEVQKAVAQTLMSERTAGLPQYDHLLVQPGEQSTEN